MALPPSEMSMQCSILYNFDNMQSAGTLLKFQSQSGQEVLTFMPSKEYQSVMISSSALQNSEIYLTLFGTLTCDLQVIPCRTGRYGVSLAAKSA